MSVDPNQKVWPMTKLKLTTNSCFLFHTCIDILFITKRLTGCLLSDTNEGNITQYISTIVYIYIYIYIYVTCFVFNI